MRQGQHGFLLVSYDAQIDGRVSVLLDGGKKGGAVGVPDLSWVEIILRIQQLHTDTDTFRGSPSAADGWV